MYDVSFRAISTDFRAISTDFRAIFTVSRAIFTACVVTILWKCLSVRLALLAVNGGLLFTVSAVCVAITLLTGVIMLTNRLALLTVLCTV